MMQTLALLQQRFDDLILEAAGLLPQRPARPVSELLAEARTIAANWEEYAAAARFRNKKRLDAEGGR